MSKKGFTLIEVLVVVVIVGILAVIAVPKLFGSIAKAKGTEVQAASGTYIHLQDAYVSENSALGNWHDIGYGAPSNGESENFRYSQGDITSKQALKGMSDSKIGWSATNRANLNDCQKNSYWSIAITNVDDKMVSYKSSVSSANCVPIVSGWDADVGLGSQAASNFESGRNFEVAEETTEESSSAAAAQEIPAEGAQSADPNAESVAAGTANSESSGAASSASAGAAVVVSGTGTGSGSASTNVGSTGTQNSGDVGGSVGGGSGSEGGSGSGGAQDVAAVTSSSSEAVASSSSEEYIDEDACDAETEASIAAATKAFEEAQQKRQDDFDSQYSDPFESIKKEISETETKMTQTVCKEEYHCANVQENYGELKKNVSDYDRQHCGSCISKQAMERLDNHKKDLQNRLEDMQKNHNYGSDYTNAKKKFDEQQQKYQEDFDKKVAAARAQCKASNKSNCTKFVQGRGYSGCKSSTPQGNGGWDKNWLQNNDWARFQQHNW